MMRRFLVALCALAYVLAATSAHAGFLIDPYTNFPAAGGTPTRPFLLGSPTTGSNSANHASLTISSHVVTAGTDLLVVRIAVADNGARTISTVVWDAAGVNESLTAGPNGDSGTVGGFRSQGAIYYKLNPTAKTANITITYAGGNVNDSFAQADNFDSVNATPIGGTNTGINSAAGTNSANYTRTTVNSYQVAICSNRTNGGTPAYTWTSPMTESVDSTTAAGTGASAYSLAEDATQTATGSQTVQCAYTGTFQIDGMAAMEINGL